MTFSGTVLTVTGGTSTEWDTAYTDRFKWNGTSTGLLASTGRTSLGATTIGAAYFMLSNPGAITFPRQNADNTLSSLSASDFRTAIGAGTGSGTVTAVTATSPITSTGGTTPVIAADTAAVTNGGSKLATGDQIYDFVNDNYLALGGGTMTGNIVLSTDAQIELDVTPGSGNASGTIIKIWSTAVTYGMCYALVQSPGPTGGWEDAMSNDDPEYAINLLGIAVGTNSVTHGMLTQGVFYSSGHGFEIGAPLYLADDPGALMNSVPGSGEIARVVGHAISEDEIYFNPDNTWVLID
jgi:hypothetical protein